MIDLFSSKGVIDIDSTKMAEDVDITSGTVNHLQSDNTEKLLIGGGSKGVHVEASLDSMEVVADNMEITIAEGIAPQKYS